MSKIKLDKQYYNEMLDRLHIVANIIDTHLQRHHVAKIEIDIKDHISNSSEELHIAIHKIKEYIKNIE